MGDNDNKKVKFSKSAQCMGELQVQMNVSTTLR